MTDPPNTYPREYRGRGRPEWRGRRCRIIETWRRQAPHNVAIEFEDGSVSVCPIRCTRRVDLGGSSAPDPAANDTRRRLAAYRQALAEHGGKMTDENARSVGRRTRELESMKEN